MGKELFIVIEFRHFESNANKLMYSINNLNSAGTDLFGDFSLWTRGCASTNRECA